MKNKRMPLLGAIVIILIVSFILITVNFNNTTDSTVENIVTNDVQETNEEYVDESVNTEEQSIEQKEVNQESIQTQVSQAYVQEQNNNIENTEGVGLVNLGQFKITAYCNCSTCCGQWAGGPTTSGVMPAAGRTIAVDPSVIPLGTKVVIDGHTYIAEDTGSAIKGNRIDMYFSSHSEALSWGVKYKNVSIVK